MLQTGRSQALRVNSTKRSNLKLDFGNLVDVGVPRDEIEGTFPLQVVRIEHRDWKSYCTYSHIVSSQTYRVVYERR
jgi:hypothetical protein